MKKIISISIFVLNFIFINGQTKEGIQKITENYNFEKINILTNKLTYNPKLEKEIAYKLAQKNGWDTIIKNKNSISKLMRVINNKPVYGTLYNIDAANSTRTNTLHNNGSLGLNLEGQNMIVGVWDGGYARTTHQEYDGIGGNNRYSRGDSGSLGLHFHAAHVTGTIMASGFEPNAKGMAPSANVLGFDWDNDLAEMSLQAGNGLLISNHSYGITIFSELNYGAYTSRSREADLIMNNSPYYLIVQAAGNDGQNNTMNSDPLDNINAFDKLNSMTCAKNSLLVANAEDAVIDGNGDLISATINSSSSQGPTDDYRIKPDITGNGTQLYSSFEDANDSYASISGTSMASPNVTGTLILLQQYYNQKNSNYMKAATLKGLALHTADDLGINGPDVIYGWGLLNAKKAAIVIEQNNVESRIQEISLTSGQFYTTTVVSDGVNPLLASISWTDPAGNISDGTINDHTPVLINDLDIRITKDAVTYYPYKLMSVTTNTTGDNLVDPFERINIDNPSGNYTITVRHKGSLTSGSQDFSLIITGIVYDGICTPEAPINTNTSFIIFGNTTLTWNEVIGATYEVRYKAENTSTWSPTLTTNDPNIELTGLTESTYIAQVRSICDNNGVITYSDWVGFDNAPQFVLTTPKYIFDRFIKVYSNEEALNIESTSNYGINDVVIYNILGKVIYKNKYSNETKIIINDSSFRNENLVIVKITLNNGNVGFKKVLLK